MSFYDAVLNGGVVYGRFLGCGRLRSVMSSHGAAKSFCAAHLTRSNQATRLVATSIATSQLMTESRLAEERKDSYRHKSSGGADYLDNIPF